MKFLKNSNVVGGGTHLKKSSENSMKIVDDIVTPTKVVRLSGGLDSALMDNILTGYNNQYFAIKNHKII